MQGFSRRTLRRPHSNLLSAGVAAPTMSLLAVPQLMAVPFSRSGNKETCHRTRGVPSFAKVAVNRMRAAKLPAASRPVGNQSASGLAREALPGQRGTSRTQARGLTPLATSVVASLASHLGAFVRRIAFGHHPERTKGSTTGSRVAPEAKASLSYLRPAPTLQTTSDDVPSAARNHPRSSEVLPRLAVEV